MALKDGATATRDDLASEAGKTTAQAVVMSGADLEFAKLIRKSGNGGSANFSGADLMQRASGKANITRAGEPTYGAAGGKVTRIIGEGFTGATGVTAGGTAFTAFSVVDDETIQATTPAKVAASYDLVVLHPDGNATATNGITYV